MSSMPSWSVPVVLVYAQLSVWVSSATPFSGSVAKGPAG
jgi:hypothetical protein